MTGSEPESSAVLSAWADSAGDGDLAAVDLGLDGGGGVDHAVEHDGDLALGGRELAGDVGEGLGARGVEGDVDHVGAH